MIGPRLLATALAAGAFLVWWRGGRVRGQLATVPWWGTLGTAVATAIAVYPAQRLKDLNFFFGDEGIVIAVAQALADGAVLYRDVWEFLQPGSFTVLAAVFAVFGSSVLVLDICVVLLFAGIAVLMQRLVAHAVSPRAAWLVTVAFILVLFPVGVWLSPHWMSTAAALAALACVLRAPPPGSRAGLLGAGLCIGLTFLFQQHKGVFLAATLGPAYLVACLAQGAGVRRTLQACGWIVAGAALAATPLVLWLTWQGLWSEWWYATFTWVLEGYGPANALRPEVWPITPGLSATQLVWGLWHSGDITLLRLLPAALLVAPVTLLWPGRVVPRWRLWLVWAGALGVFGTALTRYENLRLLYTVPTTLVLAALTLAHLREVLPPARRGLAHLARTSVRAALVAILCAAAGRQILAHARELAAGRTVPVASPRGPVLLWSGGWGHPDDVQVMLAALRTLPPSSRLFVYPTGGAYFYLSGLRNGTPYHFVLPVYTRPRQWARLDAALAAGQVDYIIWDRTYSPAWMRTVYATLAPESVWENPLVTSLQGPGWRPIVETTSAVLYRRIEPDAPR